ncbi:ATP-binding cassette domain-containing protein [Longimicrobium sp.]|uniref:ATP-binding cassette domain-containing protein n=1 Tax=Longimicrobium sp. TaxID=2029185 RepID=UPI003B3A6315
MRAQPLFAADSIGKSFGSRTILKAASVWGREGTISVLFGRNGCGKSTLLKIGAGQLRADHGVVQFAGRAYLRPRLCELASRGLFYLPDRDLLSRRLTLAEQIRAVEWRFGASRTAEVLERLEIGGLLDQTPLRLSGGERRRAEIAVAWIRAPRCLLADEPFAGIDPADAEVVAEAFRRMARQGCAIVITGHEVRQLLATADDIVWMSAGTTHGMGTPEQAVRHEQFRREYLGPVRLG